MTPDQFRAALVARGLSRQIDAAAALGVNVSSISKWLAGIHPIPALVVRALGGIPSKDTKRARSRATVPAKSSK